MIANLRSYYFQNFILMLSHLHIFSKILCKCCRIYIYFQKFNEKNFDHNFSWKVKNNLLFKYINDGITKTKIQFQEY